ncbi:type II secretion system protein GspM [Oceanicoccus sp. KOV_DT_Chl]|uniref:type II secretion system protein GspM n=1 Tax=Oceanicoccus sp. KOV_DT_Chl TaxID=1904639 RepID=UPI000C7CCFBA|nr:type II secretion system protein M [Oceanicoccus sp. KOV_DT_Chl]
MQQWFNNLTRQEQLLLLCGGASVILYVLFVLILQPMSSSVAQLEVQNQRAAETLNSVTALAAEYEALKQKGYAVSNQSQNLTRLIDNTVKKNGLAMSRFQPSSSGDVQVRFENAAFNNIVAWLHELENEQGVVIKDLSVSPGSDSGYVNVSVRLRQDA